MIAAMRWLSLPLMMAAPAAAQFPAVPPTPVPVARAPVPAIWNPAADYITPGQDEPGYRAWYAAASWRRDYVRAFHDYLTQHGAAGAVPTWQLLRTATSWHRCGGEPFEVPPVKEWPHIVQTLRYIQAYVVPAIGPVEAVSGYRNPHLNHCAGGAPESAHKSYSAIDLVPLRPTTREELMRTLCAVHSRRGGDYGVGLGFYAFLRFHVDTTKYRRWGVDGRSPDCPPIIRTEDVASVAQPVQADPSAAAVAASETSIAVSPAPPQPLGPPQDQPPQQP